MNLDTLQVEIRAITGQFNREIDGVKGKLGELGGQTEKASSRMADGFAKVGGVAVKSLKVGAVAAVAAVAASIPGAVRRIDTLVAFPRMLEAMGSSADEAQAATERLAQKLRGLPTPLQDGARGVQALVASGLEVPKATDAYLAFNNAMLAANVETGAAQATFTQLTQAISRGKIEGQEWNSIAANMPTALQALQQESGLTRVELQELYRTDPQKLLDDLIRLNVEGGGGLASLEEQARAATGGIGTAIENMKNAITRGIEGIVRALGDGDLEAGQRKISDGITAIGTAFGAVLGFIAEYIPPVINAISGVFETVKGKLLEVWESVKPIVAWFMENLWPALVEIGKYVGGQLKEAWDSIKESFETLSPILEFLAMVIGGLLVGALVTFVVGIAAVLAIGATLINWTVKAGKFFVDLGKWIVDTIVNVIEWAGNLYSDVTKFFGDAWDWIKARWSEVTGWFGNVFNGIINWFAQIPGRMGGFFADAWSRVVSIWQSIGGWFGDRVNDIISFFWNLPGKVREVFDNAVAKIKEIDWAGIGVDIIKGIGGGIASMGGWLADQAKAAVGNAKDALKNFLKIKSPSQVMRDEIGKMLGLGIAEGIDASTGEAVKSALSSAKSIMGAYDLTTNLPSTSQLSGRFEVALDARMAELDGRMTHITVKVGEDTLVDKIIGGINDKSFLSNDVVITV